MADKQRCQEKVSPPDRWGVFHQYQCMKTAVVERDGKHYCKIHDPEYIAAKSKERREKWDADYKRKQKGWARESAIAQAFQGLTLEQINERLEQGKCPCCGRSVEKITP